MTVRRPILDDRSYAQLRDELVARIPVYAPEWTDHHPSDPGITLIELFAYLGENLLFRFNQIPDATKLAFLDLLDVDLRPAQPSRGMVHFTATATAGIDVQPGTKVLAGDVAFQTEDEVWAWPVEARAAIRSIVTDELDADTLEYLARSAVAVGASRDAVTGYKTSFRASDPTRPGGDVLRPADSIDGTVYVALTGDAPIDEMAGGRLTIGVVPAEHVTSMEERAQQPCPGDGLSPPSPPMQWQICTTIARPDATDPDAADPVWRDLAVRGDTSAGLTIAGVVTLELPTDLSDIGVYLPADPDAIGAGDQPPLVEDPAIFDRLRAWLRVFRPTGGDLPALEWLGSNASRVEQTVPARAEFLGTGSGDPAQTRRLVHGNVIGPVEVEVEEHAAGRWVRWQLVEDLRGSGVDDRHVTLDRESGTLACGDGRRGRVWQLGERIRVLPYRHGGGVDGNVGPGSIAKAPGIGGLRCENPLPTSGGVDAEPLADGVERIPGELRRHDRAVTASDFRELAEETPGAGVARAEVLARFHPLDPGVEAAGVVSVVVFPDHDRSNPTAPSPTRTTLDAVCRHLDARRLITTELHVIPPTYRDIAVSVGLAVKDGFGIEAVRRWVEQVLRQYLAPVPPYGPEGRGWPLGRRVFAPELEAAALQVDGVEFLEPGEVPGSPCQLGLRLATRVGATEAWTEPASRAVALHPWEVPHLASITVIEGPALDPGVSLVPPPAPGPPVAVRSPREVCS